MQFKRITNGTCDGAGMLPISRGNVLGISDVSLCEAAARQLGLVDAHAALTDLVDRPEGCHILHDTASGRESLWMSTSSFNFGNSGGASKSGEALLFEPICMSSAAAAVQPPRSASRSAS